MNEALESSGVVYSFEVYPPKKKEDCPRFEEVLRGLTVLRPCYVEVTLSAGGSASGSLTETLDICEHIQKEFGFPAVPHLTCLGKTPQYITDALSSMRSRGIINVLALRGDGPAPAPVPTPDLRFRYGIDLVRFIRESQDGPGLGVAVAGYPDVHPDAESLEEDVRHLVEKVGAGAEVVVTQFFYDPERYLEFKRLFYKLGGNKECKVVPGIMLFRSYAGFERMAKMASGKIMLPPEGSEVRKAFDMMAEAKCNATEFKKWSLAFSTEMCKYLIEKGGERFFHFYTLNCCDLVSALLNNLGVSVQQ